jgi:hypothetical protein
MGRFSVEVASVALAAEVCRLSTFEISLTEASASSLLHIDV